jgi:phosphoribosylformimino-5-aminoimidazole carboxamide ribotide isomerase
MILIIPAIEIEKGKCRYCVKGEAGTESYYAQLSNDLIELVKLWRRENAKTIHITDFDSFNNNQQNKYQIVEVAKSIDIPIQLLYDFNSIDECTFFLDNGIYRIALSLLALSDYNSVASLILKYGSSRIVFYLDLIDGVAEFENLKLKISEYDYLEHIASLGAGRIIYKEKKWINDFNSDVLIKLSKLSQKFNLKLTLMDIVESVEDLWELQKYIKYGIDSVIISKPLYDNKFPCQRIWRLIEKKVDLNISSS